MQPFPWIEIKSWAAVSRGPYISLIQCKKKGGKKYYVENDLVFQ